MRRTKLFWLVVIFTVGTVMDAQERAIRRTTTIFELTYRKYPDGCLVLPWNDHFETSLASLMHSTPSHRNDNALIRNEIARFNTFRNNRNAVSSANASFHISQLDIGQSLYVYYIISDMVWGVVSVDSQGRSVGGAATLITYIVRRVEIVPGRGPGTEVAPTPSRASTESQGSITFLMGYNFSSEMPIGFTIGFGSFYTSWNFRLIPPGGSSSDSPHGISTGETVDLGLEFTAGWAFNLIPGRLRLPVGIGMNLTDTFHQYAHSGETTWRQPDGIFEHRRFIMETGLQLILGNWFYISSTVRGFSRFGFTLGAGFAIN